MRKPKTRTLSRFGVQADTTAHLFDDTLADGQSQPGPLDKTVEFHETLEDRLLLLLGQEVNFFIDNLEQNQNNNASYCIFFYTCRKYWKSNFPLTDKIFRYIFFIIDK